MVQMMKMQMAKIAWMLKTGLSLLGINGTLQLFPQSAHTASNICLSSDLPESLLSNLAESDPPLWFSKQLLQYTGLPWVGLKGTSHSFPQLSQTALCISTGPRSLNLGLLEEKLCLSPKEGLDLNPPPEGLL